MKDKLVPRLRFLNFVSAKEDWEEKPLKILAEKITAKNQKIDVKKVFTNSAISGIVNQRDYFDKDIANQEGLQQYYIVAPGDYVYNPRISNEAPVGPISKNKTGETGVMSPLYTVFRFFEDDNEFYTYYFKTEHWFNAIRKAANSGVRFDRMSITDSVFMDIPVLYPKPKEQQKIADCLSSLDDLISAETEKLDALKSYKRGLMQQLFPAAGEKIPKLRFPEFRDSGKWRQETLGNLVNIRSGSSPSSYKLLKFGRIPFLKVEDLNNCIKYQTESREYANGGTNVVPVNSLIFPKRGAAILLNKLRINKTEVLMDSNLMAVTPKNSVDEEFLYYSILVVGLAKIADTSTIPQLNNKHIIPQVISIPSTLEQKKISECLSSLDEQINIQVDRIDCLKQHKKGLIQDLFPNIN